uniref:FGENESH: predicted gene_16.58 protein n=1 Tax=Rhodotorula toruloides TaxID=5286 RepID=A0A0K3CV56_RHOTO
MPYLHDSDTPAGVMGQLPGDVMKRETGSAHRLPTYLPAHDFVSAAKHASDAVEEYTPQGQVGKMGDGN